MPVEDAYRDDLAYIHDVGYGSIAADAARRLITELTAAGCRDGTIVDLGCGSGILAKLLADAGYRVVGIDVSKAMVSRARAAVPAAEFRVGSFVSADLPASVAVVAVGEVLNYRFDDANDHDARVDLFERIHDALAPGGLLMFDAATRDRTQPCRTFAEGPDWAVLVEADVDSAREMLTRKITTFRKSGTLFRRDMETHRLTLLDPTTISRSLETAGFEVQVISQYDAVALASGTALYLCRKPA